MTLAALGFLAAGVFIGLVVGAIPGLTATLATALLLPFTFSLPAVDALLALTGIYIGGIYGGSVTAITVRIPGAPANTMTLLDGHAMARAGRTEDLLTGEFPKYLHAKYRLSDKREHRAVMGVSAGGFGALKIAMRHSDKFGAVAAYSSAILPADPDDLSGMYEGMVNRMLRRGLGECAGASGVHGLVDRSAGHAVVDDLHHRSGEGGASE